MGYIKHLEHEIISGPVGNTAFLKRCYDEVLINHDSADRRHDGVFDKVMCYPKTPSQTYSLKRASCAGMTNKA
jgi:hypothetical protein